MSALQAALAYCRAGLAILPTTKDKRPDWSLLPQKVDGTGPTWMLELSDHPQPFTEAEVRVWFKDDLNRPYAVRTGAINGFIVVDPDNEAAHAEAQRRGLPETVTTKTLRGWHFKYKYDPAIRQGKPFPGCDIKSDGGYIIGEGSPTIKSGIFYSVVSPKGTPLAPAPVWLKTPVNTSKPAPAKQAAPAQQFTGSDLDRALFNLNYIRADVDRRTWIMVAGILKDAGASANEFDAWSQTAPEKYAENGSNEIDKVWRSLKGGKGADGRALSKLANEHSGGQAARDWWRANQTDAGLPTLREGKSILISEKQASVVTEKPADPLPDTWPTDLPAVIDRLWSATGLASAAIILFGTVLRAIADSTLNPDDLTVKAMAESTGLSDRQVRNGLEKGDGIFFTLSGEHSAACRLSTEMTTGIHTIQVRKSDRPIVKNVESLSAANEGHRPSKLYVLNPPAVTIQKILDRVVLPQAKLRQYPNQSADRFAPPDPELLRAAGLDASDLQLLSDSLSYPANNVTAQRAVDDKVSSWRKQLADLTPLALPALPEDIPITNGKRLRAAKVLAAALPHVESKISLKELARTAGTSESTVQRTLPFAGIGMKENVEFVTVNGPLPALGYDFTLKGVPYRARYVDENGEYSQDIPYTIGQDVINPNLARLAAAGRPIEVGYRLAGTPYQMNAAERQQVLTEHRMRQSESKCARTSGSISQTQPTERRAAPRHDMPGYPVSFGMEWRARLSDHLPSELQNRFAIKTTELDSAVSTPESEQPTNTETTSKPSELSEDTAREIVIVASSPVTEELRAAPLEDSHNGSPARCTLLQMS